MKILQKLVEAVTMPEKLNRGKRKLWTLEKEEVEGTEEKVWLQISGNAVNEGGEWER